jgi:hypothetical protein
MDKSQTPTSNAALGTDPYYHRVEGIRRASRNGRVSDLPPEIPKVTIRNLSIAYLGLEVQRHRHRAGHEVDGHGVLQDAMSDFAGFNSKVCGLIKP